MSNDKSGEASLRPADTARAGDRAIIQKWRDHAIEAAAAIVKRYVEINGAAEAAYAVIDILALHSDPAVGKAAIGGYEIGQTPIATPSPLTDEVAGSGEINCAQIAMGHGMVDVGPIEWKGRSGIILHPRAEHIPVGEPGALSGNYWPSGADVVIWIDAPAGATVIIDELAALASTPQLAAAETVDSWLVEQLEAWPRRVDPNKTTNVEYLMKEAAKVIRQSAKGGE